MPMKKLFFLLILLLISSLSFSSLVQAQTWQEPSQSPPQGQLPGPVWLQETLPGTLQQGNILLSSSKRIGLGTNNPGYYLDIQNPGLSPDTVIIRLANDNPFRLWTGLRLDRSGLTEKWFIGMNDSDDKLRFRSNGSDDAVVINELGRVGIGTANPNSMLHVYARPSHPDPTRPYAAIFEGKVGIDTITPNFTLDVAGRINAQDGLCINGTCKTSWNEIGGYWSANGNHIYNNNSGNVGIGTANPQGKLDVDQVFYTERGRISIRPQDTSSGGSEGGEIRLMGAGSYNSWVIDNYQGRFRWHDNQDEYMTITPPRGNEPSKVGIGTANPEARLDLGQLPSQTEGLRIKISSSNPYSPFVVVNASGNDVFRIKENGNVGIGTANPDNLIYRLQVGNCPSPLEGTCVYINGKLDASEIDPIYEIEGVKYATYGLSTVGLKEETVGKVKLLNCQIDKLLYCAVIDFNKAEKGSDLWLFRKVTAFGNNWQDLVVTLTPQGRAQTWYEVFPEKNQLIIFSDHQVDVSYRLIAPRFDWPSRKTNLVDQNTPAHFKIK